MRDVISPSFELSDSGAGSREGDLEVNYSPGIFSRSGFWDREKMVVHFLEGENLESV